MTTTTSWREESVEVGGSKVQVFKGGSGPPLFALHGAGGNRGWMPYHQTLSESYTVYVPSHPGYDQSEQPPWLTTMNDMAHFYLAFFRTLGYQQVRLMGFSMGGWLAAEIAAMCPSAVQGQVLVDAVGIRPKQGEIAELLLVGQEATQDLIYHDPSKAPPAVELTAEEQLVQWNNREMASRLCWTPYMHNPKLPSYLELIDVPSLIVWGRQDRIAPVECGELYQQALKGSKLHVIEECGHSPHNEQPQEFLSVAMDFLGSLS